MRPIGLPAESTTCTSTAITSTVLRNTVCAEIAATQPAASTVAHEIRKRWLAPFRERCQPPFTKCVTGGEFFTLLLPIFGEKGASHLRGKGASHLLPNRASLSAICQSNADAAGIPDPGQRIPILI